MNVERRDKQEKQHLELIERLTRIEARTELASVIDRRFGEIVEVMKTTQQQAQQHQIQHHKGRDG
jgi:hypothetical protein